MRLYSILSLNYYYYSFYVPGLQKVTLISDHLGDYGKVVEETKTSSEVF